MSVYKLNGSQKAFFGNLFTKIDCFRDALIVVGDMNGVMDRSLGSS